MSRVKSADINQNGFDDIGDGLTASRGMFLGVLISLPLWAAIIGTAIWLFCG